MPPNRNFNNGDEVWVQTYPSGPEFFEWTRATVFVGAFSPEDALGWRYQLDIDGYPDDVNREEGGWWGASDMRVLPDGCKLRHPQGSECGTCECRTPNDCPVPPGRRHWEEER